MRWSLFSFVFASMAILSAAHAAPVPEQTETRRETVAVRVDALDMTKDPLSVAFRLEDWLKDNGSGAFPPDFSDEDRRSDPWDEPPQ